MDAGVNIIVGDADGANTAVQRFCVSLEYKNVTVFASNGKARNNLGGFPMRNVRAAGFGRDFFTQKDIAMTDASDCGLVIWDGKSKGTKTNIDRLAQQNKPCQIFRAGV